MSSLKLAPKRFERTETGGYDYLAKKFTGDLLVQWLQAMRLAGTPCPSTAAGLCALMEREFGRERDDEWQDTWESLIFEPRETYRSFFNKLNIFVLHWKHSTVYLAADAEAKRQSVSLGGSANVSDFSLCPSLYAVQRKFYGMLPSSDKKLMMLHGKDGASPDVILK
jgi:hypothetical protein